MIIKENNYSKLREFVCPKCKSVLGVSVEDIKHDVDGDPYISCPLCKKATYVDENEWFGRKIVNVNITTKPFESN